jgi:integrase
LLNLLVRQVDLEEGTIGVYRGATKNGESRRVFMPDTVQNLLKECCKGKGPDDFVFTWKGTRRVKDFRHAWERLTEIGGSAGPSLPRFETECDSWDDAGRNSAEGRDAN